MIEKIIKGLELRVEFTDDKYIAAIHDLEEEETKHEEKLDLHKPDGYVMELLIKNENDAKAVLDLHLDSRPKLYDVTYDNIDLTVNSSEYLMGQRDNSVHWCSSIIVEDVVDAREICDKEYDRNILRTDFEDRIDLTPAEREHLLFDYVQMVANLIASNWPNLFPDLKKERIKHQYSTEFEKEVKVVTGPLVCETESTLEGISKVITQLTDELCPAGLNDDGHKVPIFPTTFSGDQKTEKSARSAQLALIDNGSMRDKLGFIVGRHELLHFMFMLTDVVQDIYSDNDNIEESSSLSRLVKLLNPRLENKKGKDFYYAFRDLYSDVYLAQLGEFLRNYLNVNTLQEDATPDNIKQEKDSMIKQKLLKLLIRKFILSVDEEYSNCEETSDGDNLPSFYPHEQFLRKLQPAVNTSEQNAEAETASETQEDTIKLDMQLIVVDQADLEEVNSLLTPATAASPAQTKTDDIISNTKSKQSSKQNPDQKNCYARSLFSFLGFYQLMLDSIKEGNGLNSYLIQKKLHRAIFSMGHKNYSCSLSSFKQTVLGHPNPQFSHRFMWNVFSGRGGKSLKFARDQHNEHLNRYLKTSFRSLGVNLNEKNAQRINNAADIGVKMESKVFDYFELDAAGKSHTKKDRSSQITKIMEIFKQEKVSSKIPGRKFNGPTAPCFPNLMMDEARYRSWHLAKDKEMTKISKMRKKYFS